MHIGVMDPVLAVLESDPRLTVDYLAETRSKEPHIDRATGRPRRWIRAADAARRRVDLFISADPWNSPTLHRCYGRMNFFHGVAGKYDLDDPSHLPIGFDQWDRVAFINTDRMQKYAALGILKPGAAVLVGFPKLDALVNGHVDGAAVRGALGLDPGRRTALYAPTWSSASSLNMAGETIITSLADAGFNVIVKPHDLSFDLGEKYSGGIDWRARLRAIERPGRIVVVATRRFVAAPGGQRCARHRSQLDRLRILPARPADHRHRRAGSAARRANQSGAHRAAAIRGVRRARTGGDRRDGAGRARARGGACAGPGSARPRLFFRAGHGDRPGRRHRLRSADAVAAADARGERPTALGRSEPLMKFSILIATYNRARELADTLSSLARLEHRESWEVIVVDNNSTDDTRAVVEAAPTRVSGAASLRVRARAGTQRGAERAFAMARGEIIVTTDDDVRVEPDWLEQIEGGLDRLGCDYVGGRVVPLWGAAPPPGCPNTAARCGR